MDVGATHVGAAEHEFGEHMGSKVKEITLTNRNGTSVRFIYTPITATAARPLLGEKNL
jgi:hypothetical protein